MSKLTRAIEELARRADAGDVKAAEGIKAYHGSPYSFDKFSTSQIGTGEGAQAYSRGLYFAEREKTAEGYRDRIAGADWVDSSGIPQQTNSITSDLTERLRADGMGVVDADRAATMWSIIARDGDQARNSPGYPVIKKYLDEKGIKLRQKGSMYEVNIDATPDEFIDWDLPLDEQSESVMNALKKTDWYEYAEEGAYNAAERRGDNAYGMDLVRWLEEDGAEDAAQMLKDAGIKGVQYADAQTRFGKGPKTKNYVVYDDKLIDITKKYGISVPLASAVAAGTMTPEEAQAGALSAGARRIIDPRFSQPVAGGSTRKGVLTDLEGMETTVDPRLMNIGRSEALYDYEGSPYILTQSDRSAAGGVVTSVKGKEIDPVNLRGGRDFMFDPQSGDLVWASDPAVVKSMYKRALELREKYKKDPLLLPYTMAPTGIDFATMPLDVMINYARQGMGRSDIKRLDEQIRKVIPSWKGVMNPEANAVFREVHGNKRKAVANIIDKNFRDVEGGLSMGEARAATSDAAQYMAPDGSIQNIGQIEISDSSSIDQLSDHPTYRGGLKGQGIGKLDVDIDARELMEDKGRELTGDAADIRALSMNHELSQGVVDEKLLRRLYDKQRPRIEAISEKFGVSIPIAAMALMGEPEEAKAELLSEVPQEQAQQLQDNWSQIEANAQAGMGGMGVRSAPVAQDEEAIIAAQQPAPTGADLMQQANDDFLSGIINQPGSFFNPETYDVIGDTARGAFDATVGFLGDMEQMLVGGIMQGIGGATTWEDALKMIGGGLGQGIINAPEGRGSRFMEGMKNYDPAFITSGEVGQVPGIIPSFGTQDEERTKRAKMLGGFFAPI